MHWLLFILLIYFHISTTFAQYCTELLGCKNIPCKYPYELTSEFVKHDWAIKNLPNYNYCFEKRDDEYFCLKKTLKTPSLDDAITLIKKNAPPQRYIPFRFKCDRSKEKEVEGTCVPTTEDTTSWVCVSAYKPNPWKDKTGALQLKHKSCQALSYRYISCCPASDSTYARSCEADFFQVIYKPLLEKYVLADSSFEPEWADDKSVSGINYYAPDSVAVTTKKEIKTDEELDEEQGPPVSKNTFCAKIIKVKSSRTCDVLYAHSHDLPKSCVEAVKLKKPSDELLTACRQEVFKREYSVIDQQLKDIDFIFDIYEKALLDTVSNGLIKLQAELNELRQTSQKTEDIWAAVKKGMEEINKACEGPEGIPECPGGILPLGRVCRVPNLDDADKDTLKSAANCKVCLNAEKTCERSTKYLNLLGKAFKKIRFKVLRYEEGRIRMFLDGHFLNAEDEKTKYKMVLTDEYKQLSSLIFECNEKLAPDPNLTFLNDTHKACDWLGELGTSMLKPILENPKYAYFELNDLITRFISLYSEGILLRSGASLVETAQNPKALEQTQKIKEAINNFSTLFDRKEFKKGVLDPDHVLITEVMVNDKKTQVVEKPKNISISEYFTPEHPPQNYWTLISAGNAKSNPNKLESNLNYWSQALFFKKILYTLLRLQAALISFNNQLYAEDTTSAEKPMGEPHRFSQKEAEWKKLTSEIEEYLKQVPWEFRIPHLVYYNDFNIAEMTFLANVTAEENKLITSKAVRILPNFREGNSFQRFLLEKEYVE